MSASVDQGTDVIDFLPSYASGRWVRLWAGGSNIAYLSLVPTDGNGRFEIYNVPNGTYVLASATSKNGPWTTEDAAYSIASNPPTGPYGAASNVTVAPTGVNLQSAGADMSGGVAADAAWTTAVAALPSGGGKVYIPPGTPRFTIQKALTTGLTIEGAGTGATVLSSSAVGAPLFKALVTNHGAITDVWIRDLTLDGVTGPAGTNEGIRIDTSAFNDITYKNIGVERVTFKNFNLGTGHAANNSGAGPMTNGVSYKFCRFENCAWGMVLSGSYGDSIGFCYFAKCTKWGLATPETVFNPPPLIGSGPTTCADFCNLNVEGLGNYAAGTDGGIGISVSNSRISDIFVSNVSLTGMSIQCVEGDLENQLTTIVFYGCGGGIQLWGGTSGGVINNLGLYACGQNQANWPGGYSQRQYPISVETGRWLIDGGRITLFQPGPIIPNYGINVGNGVGAIARLEIARLGLPTFAIGPFIVQDTTPGIFFLRDCPGYNPVGVVTPAVPASTVAVAAQPYDRHFYITTGAGVTTIAIQNGPTITLQASVAGQFVYVPAGKSMTPTFANAPTWVVEGL